MNIKYNLKEKYNETTLIIYEVFFKYSVFFQIIKRHFDHFNLSLYKKSSMNINLTCPIRIHSLFNKNHYRHKIIVFLIIVK